MNILRSSTRLQAISIQLFASLDGQGKPSYGSAATVYGRVIRKTEVVRLPSGEEVRLVAAAWIDGNAVRIPNVNDRITLADGLVGIVLDRTDGRSLSNPKVLDHVHIRIREESAG
jgi:hypothetical protein